MQSIPGDTGGGVNCVAMAMDGSPLDEVNNALPDGPWLEMEGVRPLRGCRRIHGTMSTVLSAVDAARGFLKAMDSAPVNTSIDQDLIAQA